ncbi:phage/plasmid replication domain-containing protein [Pseudomonas sp. Pseu.R1]|uniref:phage/plasmid replication domain-containing protein n=1 Tax=Pseudomonas sp. Pseu.R1 TaxID=3379818 RepID=UPI003B93A6AB
MKAPWTHESDCPGFYDWVKVYQEYPFDLPKKSSRIIRHFDGETDELLAETAPAFMAEGSYCTSMRIHVCGRKITVDGNPSRINRLDNVFGLTSLDHCMRVINSILIELGLPAMTRCTSVQRLQNGNAIVDGAVFQRLDLTCNAYVGRNNERAYLRGLSSQRFRHSIGYLYPDCNTVVWTPKGGEKAGRLVYPGVYNKAAEITAHLLRKVKRTFTEDSDEYRYVLSLRDWCASVGMVRYEIKLRSEHLQRERHCYWGLFKEADLWEVHGEFLRVGDKMNLEAYDVVSITQELISKGVCKSVQAAGRTAGYAYEWMNGATFDFNKSAVQEHRARLRRIGIDIKMPHDSARHGVVFIHNVREVEVSLDVVAPSFYRAAQLPRHLQLVAA